MDPEDDDWVFPQTDDGHYLWYKANYYGDVYFANYQVDDDYAKWGYPVIGIIDRG